MVFLDESGFLLVPSVRRTWARRGRTPILCAAGRWTKISAISAVSISPRRKKAALYLRFHRDRNIRMGEVVGFLNQLLRHLKGPVVVLWDSSPVHKGAAIRSFLENHPRLYTYRFPGYAPELNPDEFVWNQLKRATANSIPNDLKHMARLLRGPAQRLRRSQKLLWSCVYASDLPWSR